MGNNLRKIKDIITPNAVKGNMCQVPSVISDSLQPYGLTHLAPLSMEFSRQEYWNGLPCPPPGDLPYQGVEPRSPSLQADCLPAELPGKPSYNSIQN